MNENAIQAIMPYRMFGTWVFDDPHAGLVREPFVLGIPEMIDVMVWDMADPSDGFRMCFSLTEPAVMNAHHIKLMALENGGAWYRDVETRMGGWLCPATLLYFQSFPDELYIWAEEMVISAQADTHLMHQKLIEEMGLEPSSTLVYDDREIATEEDWMAYLEDSGLPITTFNIPSREDK